jgi:hypothetical protein
MNPSRIAVGEVQEISVGDKRERNRFIAVEHAVIADQPLAIREIASDIHTRLQGRSPFFHETQHAAFVTAADGRDVARCTAMINRRWQRDKTTRPGSSVTSQRCAMPSRRWPNCSPSLSSGWPSAVLIASSPRSTAPRSTASVP